MILKVHGSLGDQVMLTGIPEAYFKLTGEKTYIQGGRGELWAHNPFVKDSKEPGEKEFSYSFNGPRDYMIYYPVRIFYDLTGKIVNRNQVQPNLYQSWERDSRIIVVNDQAGWPSRTGYRYWNELMNRLIAAGFIVTYIRNNNFRNCFGQTPAPSITSCHHQLLDIPLSNLIEVIGRAAFFIGYNSGLSQLAGALSTPYALLDGAIPPINTAHNSCVYTTTMPDCNRCAQENCAVGCLGKLEDINFKILSKIIELDNLKKQTNATNQY